MFRYTFSFFLFFFLFGNCITTYSTFPKAEKPKPEEVYKTKLVYDIQKFEVLEFGGYEALKTIFKGKIIFENTEQSKDIPKEGYYCKVKAEWVPFTIPTLIFLFISNNAYTLIPAWSEDEGYIVTYSLYNNGELIKDFPYRIRRSIYYWGLLIPFLWGNLLTPNEEFVFQNTAYQFAKDVKPYFK